LGWDVCKKFLAVGSNNTLLSITQLTTIRYENTKNTADCCIFGKYYSREVLEFNSEPPDKGITLPYTEYE
jgi:hypothetical protein